jgi:hypothetical protein
LLVAVAAGGLALRSLFGFVLHLRGTLTYHFGATGRGRVLRQGVLRATPKDNVYLVAVVFEVTPDDGSAVFVDQECLLVGSATMAKLVPNNVLAVRFDRARQHVILKAPPTVL